jgi:formamidopyrimidine-DNA glycosylase
MPELPEVETTVRGLERVLGGRRIASVEARRPDLRRALPVDLGQRLTGSRVTKLRRREKYGLIDTDRGDTLVFHLGMSGHWRVDPAQLAKHDHFILETDEGRRVALNDARRFGSLDIVPTDDLQEWPAFKALGPEPFGLDARDLKRRLGGRSAAIKLLLLDQGIVAGLGNIYVCEALYRAGIHPRRAGGSLSLERLKRLVPAIEAVLNEAIAAGGSTLRDFASPDGELGYFSKDFSV